MKGFLGRRDGWWHYVRRVSAVYAQHDRRGIVRQSTTIRIADDPRGIAAAKAVAAAMQRAMAVPQEVRSAYDRYRRIERASSSSANAAAPERATRTPVLAASPARSIITANASGAAERIASPGADSLPSMAP